MGKGQEEGVVMTAFWGLLCQIRQVGRFAPTSEFRLRAFPSLACFPLGLAKIGPSVARRAQVGRPLRVRLGNRLWWADREDAAAKETCLSATFCPW